MRSLSLIIHKMNKGKFCWLVFYFTLLTLNIYAQEKKSFIAIRGGASIPFGKYHSTSLEEGSFTQTGFNVSLEGAWFFLPKFGVGASTGINLHPVDVSALGWEVVQNDPFMEDVYIRSDPYQIITAMGGSICQTPDFL